jgi:hypothetical protein
MRGHAGFCVGKDCPACEQLAEERAEAKRSRAPEPLDRFGRDADWNFPRGAGWDR